MRITFVEPRIAFYSWIPLNLLYLSSYLREKCGYEPIVIDTNPLSSIEEIVKHILSTNPDVIGITCTTPQWRKTRDIAIEIKKLTNVPIIVGGIHPSVCPKEVLSEPAIDYISFGEGELTSAELCKSIELSIEVDDIAGIGYKKNNQIFINPCRERINDLDEVPFPAWDLIDIEKYFEGNEGLMGVPTKRTINVITQRGCPFHCSFCNSSKLWDRKVKRRSVDNVLMEIEFLRNNFHVDSVKFFDDCFIVNYNWVFEFCEKLKKKQWRDFKWECYSRVDLIREDVIQQMKLAGCVTIHLGVESGSPKILKTIDKNISVEQIEKAFNIIKRNGVKAFSFIIIGFPNEELEDILLTEKLLRKIRPDGIEVDFAIPFPGTKLFEEVVQLGLIEEDVNYNNWFEVNGTRSYHDKPIYNHLISYNDLIKAKGRLQNIVLFGRYKHFFKSPKQFFKGIKIFFKGIHRLPIGIINIFMTKRFDAVFVEVYRGYMERSANQKWN